MPNGIAVTRMTPRYSKPLKTWSIAGTGSEKPKFEKAAESPPRLMPPMPSPSAAEPQATSMPKAIATSPAGMPRG